MNKPNIQLQPLNVNTVLKNRVYEALKTAISSIDVYADEAPPKLDERRLAEELGVSRTPIREARIRLSIICISSRPWNRGTAIWRNAMSVSTRMT